MYKAEFKLKQHTPIIHFQPDQEGATLRATEVKPLLDKYIWEELIAESGEDRLVAYDKNRHLLKGSKIENDSKSREQFSNGVFPSLDYQLLIKAGDILTAAIVHPYPCYFGNLGQNTPKNFSYSNGLLTLRVNTYHTELLVLLERYMKSFFSLTNFGTRASKGFGSFTLQNEYDSSYTYSSFKSRVRGSKPQFDGFKDLFADIDIFYRSVRSGINTYTRRNNEFVHLFYMKPLLWQYFKGRFNVNWEKKKIKQTWYEDIQRTHENRYQRDDGFEDTPTGYDKKNFLSIKDLMGLSSSEEWKNPYNISLKKEVKSHDGGLIERAASPLLIKPVLRKENEWNVNFYCKYSESGNSVINSEVTFKSGQRQPFTLQTPGYFDLQELFDEIVGHDFEIDDFILFNNNSDIRDRLDRIYKDIIVNRKYA